VNTKQNYINHIALVIDQSSSMDHLRDQVVQVVDSQIAFLAKQSKELDQETRVTVYTFADRTECIFYDKDVLRMPSLKGLYRPDGMTALVDATIKAIDDLSKTPELYGDHAFLVYVITDGGENRSVATSYSLEQKIRGLKDHWTVATFVPNEGGKRSAQRYGFPADNVAIWETSKDGLAGVGETIRAATNTYMTQRAAGVRGTKNLFALNTNVTKADVKQALTKLHYGQYRTYDVKEEGPIAPFVESKTKRAYRSGEAFFQLTKREKVQADKEIVLLDKKTKELFKGTGDDARKLLGLPDHEVKVAPASHPDFDIFIQSTSVNRKLVPGTKLLVIS
jgi:hypothetical protein